MAGIVWAADALLPPLADAVRLVTLVGVGMAAYAGLLFVFERAVVDEAVRLIRPAKPQTL